MVILYNEIASPLVPIFSFSEGLISCGFKRARSVLAGGVTSHLSAAPGWGHCGAAAGERAAPLRLQLLFRLRLPLPFSLPPAHPAPHPAQRRCPACLRQQIPRPPPASASGTSSLK